MRHLPVLAAAFAAFLVPVVGRAAGAPDPVRAAVGRIVEPLMAADAIPGMAVGVVVDGRERVFDYGVASKSTGRRVDARTLFEVGSISKLFSATLASVAECRHRLALSDTVGQVLPSLADAPIGSVTLLELGTHTPGGFPLQFPDAVTDDASVLRYYRDWHPAFAPGSERTYSNPGIGLFGLAVASRLAGDFASLERSLVFAPLGLRDTFLDVPPSRRPDYALGTTGDGRPARLAPGPLAAEIYGVRTTASDLLHFVAGNIDPASLEPTLGCAIERTHVGWFRVPPMTQDLVWEQLDEPVALASLLDANSDRMILHPNPAQPIEPPVPPRSDVWINKTGTTNGFAAYAALIPERRIGIVLLANRNIPAAARVTAAWRIVQALSRRAPQR